MDASGLLQDSLPSPATDTSTSAARFRPYASQSHHVTKGRYITSNDPRGYIPVYEYPLNGQWIMMDSDDGYILWTGIWKALGNAKADIVRMLESQPDLAPQLRRVRGGYLKIQGTWMPYEVALRLARRVAWPIRDDLVPLFGPTFPSTCLSPDQPGYGQVVSSATGRRRTRRNVLHNTLLPVPSQGPSHKTERRQETGYPTAVEYSDQTQHGRYKTTAFVPSPSLSHPTTVSSIPSAHFSPHHVPHLKHHDLLKHPGRQSPTTGVYPQLAPDFSGSGDRSALTSSSRHSINSDSQWQDNPTRDRSTPKSRYTPYGPTPRNSSGRPLTLDLPPLKLPHRPQSQRSQGSDPWRKRPSSSSSPSTTEPIQLPPINSNAVTESRRFSSSSRASDSTCMLPPISTLEDGLPSASDSAAVLRRLTLDDEALGLARFRRVSEQDEDEREPIRPTTEQLWMRRRSLSAPPLNQELGQPRTSTSQFDTNPIRYRDESRSETVHWQGFHQDGRHQPPTHHSNSHPRGGYRMSASSSSTTHDDMSPCETSPLTPSTPPSMSGASTEGDGRQTGWSRAYSCTDVEDARQLERQGSSHSVPTSGHPWPMPPPSSHRQQVELESYRFGHSSSSGLPSLTVSNPSPTSTSQPVLRHRS